MIKLKDILNEGFKSEYKGNDSIIWKKGKTRGDVTNFTPYYKGHDIDTGGYNFKTEKELNDFIKDYILSNQLYNKYRFESVIEENVDNTIKLKDILNEYSSDVEETKMFEQSTVTKIIDDIKKLLDWKDKQYGDQRFDYSEYRFASGSGGFSFKWDHARNWGGQIGVSFDEKSGNHKYYAYSWYDKKLTGSATTNNSKPFKFKGKPMVWKDFTNDHLLEFWKKVKGDIKKNEAGSKAALDQESKAQAAYYGSKSNTGRIGYGLSSQPRR